MTPMSTIKNYKRSSLAGVLVSTTRYEDVNWTTHLDPATEYQTTIYVIETWEELSTPGTYQRGTTSGTVEVKRPSGQRTGWCVRLFGEELPERYADKGAAQHAAEALVLA